MDHIITYNVLLPHFTFVETEPQKGNKRTHQDHPPNYKWEGEPGF